MPASTVQDIMDAMTDHGFSDTTTARKLEVINDAYQDVCSRSPWPFLEKSTTGATVAGNATFTNQPADLSKIISMVIDSTSQTLIPARLDDIMKRFSGQLTQQGPPLYYYFVGETIKFYPVPDSAYTITVSYISAPTKLANTTDTFVIPDRHARVILLGAVASAYDMEDDTDLAMKFDAKFERRIATMQADMNMKQFDRPDMMYDLFQSDDLWG